MVCFDVLNKYNCFFVHLKTLFFDHFHFLVICMAIWGFWLKTLSWKLLWVRIRSGVGWEIETSCFGLNCCQVMWQPAAKEPGSYFWTFDMLAGVSRYDFHTLKMAKSEIFWNLVGSLWKGPWWLLLIEKLSEMVCFDVLKGAALFLVHLKTLFFDHFRFLVICMAIWDFGLKTLRWKLLRGRIRSGVGWEIETSCFGVNCCQVMSPTHAKENGPYFWTFDMLAGVSRYDFRTLKMAKSEIFWKLVGSLWNGPWWLLLIEKLSEMVCFDVIKGPALFMVHLKRLSFACFSCPRHMHGDLRIWVENT